MNGSVPEDHFQLVSERSELRDRVLDGARSGPGTVADADFFEATRRRIATEGDAREAALNV